MTYPSANQLDGKGLGRCCNCGRLWKAQDLYVVTTDRLICHRCYPDAARIENRARHARWLDDIHGSASKTERPPSSGAKQEQL